MSADEYVSGVQRILSSALSQIEQIRIAAGPDEDGSAAIAVLRVCSRITDQVVQLGRGMQCDACGKDFEKTEGSQRQYDPYICPECDSAGLNETMRQELGEEEQWSAPGGGGRRDER